jgi:hypothetical protein
MKSVGRKTLIAKKSQDVIVDALAQTTWRYSFEMHSWLQKNAVGFAPLEALIKYQCCYFISTFLPLASSKNQTFAFRPAQS